MIKQLENPFKKEAKKICYLDCGITTPHKLLEHDWCCQVCGGSHSERICPDSKIPILHIFHTNKKLAGLQIQKFLKSFLNPIYKEKKYQ